MWAVVNVGKWGAVLEANFAQMSVDFIDCFVRINAFCYSALICDENKDIAFFCECSERFERCRQY